MNEYYNNIHKIFYMLRCHFEHSSFVNVSHKTKASFTGPNEEDKQKHPEISKSGNQLA